MLHEYGKPLKSLTQIKLTSHIELKWRIGNKLKLSILGMSHTIFRHTQVNFAASNVGFSNQELSQEFQLDNFGECLNRAKIAKIVRLENNNISTLNSILKGITSSFPEYDALNSPETIVPSGDIRCLNGCWSTLNKGRWGRGRTVRCRIFSAFLSC